MSYYKPRYGLTHDEVKNLAGMYYKKNLPESDFEDFDDFARWAAESGRQQYAQLRKRDPDKPHGPENSFWYIRPPYQKVERHDYTCKFCEGCDKGSCQTVPNGCREWRKWFVENWNEYICIKPKEPEPRKREVFRYEHPDLVREGIVFGTASDS